MRKITIEAWAVLDKNNKICATPVSYFMEAKSPFSIYRNKNPLNREIQKRLKLKIVPCKITYNFNIK